MSSIVPVLDGPYSRDTYRRVVRELGSVDAYAQEADWWLRLPVRVIFDCDGHGLEVGPYRIDLFELDVLRHAIDVCVTAEEEASS